MDLFKKCIPSIKKAIEEAKINKNQIEDIILVGGSSRIPKIQSMIQEYFGGKNINLQLHYKESNACGAAIQAAIMTGVKDDRIEKLVLLEVIPFSLGIKGISGNMNICLPGNNVFPCKKTQTFSYSTGEKGSITIKIYEGDNSSAEKNYLLGTLELTGFPYLNAEAKIEITFELTPDSDFRIYVEDKLSGVNSKNISMIVNDRDRLNKLYINNKKKEIINFDKLEKEKENAKINFDIYCYGVKEILNNEKIKNNILKEEELVIKNKLIEILNWRSNYPFASPEEYDSKKNKLINTINPAMKKIYENYDGIF